MYFGWRIRDIVEQYKIYLSQPASWIRHLSKEQLTKTYPSHTLLSLSWSLFQVNCHPFSMGGHQLIMWEFAGKINADMRRKRQNILRRIEIMRDQKL